MPNSKLHVLCVTWNAKGAIPRDEDIIRMLSLSRKAPDIIAFTVQETLEMKLSPIVKATFDNKKPKIWRRVLEHVVTSNTFRGEKYSTVDVVSLLGLFLIVFTKQSLFSKLRYINHGKSVANTRMGNKGGVAVRFDIWSSDGESFRSFCFVGVHLTSKEGKNKKKNADLQVITRFIKWKKKKNSALGSLRQPKRYTRRRRKREKSNKQNKTLVNNGNESPAAGTRGKKYSVTLHNGRRITKFETTTASVKSTASSERPETPRSFTSDDEERSQGATELDEDNISMLDHDAVFIFGDLNYRLENVDIDTVMGAIAKGGNRLRELQLNYDHLEKNMVEQKALVNFKEGRKRFPPTYKFEVGTSNYVSNRTPSWTDRVVFKTSSRFSDAKVLLYDSVQDIVSSDHKPVVKELLLRQ